MSSRIRRVEAFHLMIPNKGRPPYLGASGARTDLKEGGYFVREVSRTVYPVNLCSTLVRIETEDGTIGWGETYGLIRSTTVSIINELFAGFLVGRDPIDVTMIYEDLYDMMRVRGYTGGFYHDALAGVDIALWDLCGKLRNASVASLLGGQRRTSISAYVSGLPNAELSDRINSALDWRERGFDSFKLHLPHVSQGWMTEFKALREALGDEVEIAADLHWTLGDADAIALANALVPYRPWFLEAMCKSEDIEGLAEVARRSAIPIAGGEEWRNVFELRRRLESGPIAIIQPEMGHVGITTFYRMGLFAAAHHRKVIPHAAIGIGVFLAASLQVASALQNATAHEFQPSVVEPTEEYLKSTIVVEKGVYTVSTTPGLGVEPSAAALKLAGI